MTTTMAADGRLLGRVANWATALGLIYVPIAALLISLAIERGSLIDITVIVGLYFLVTYFPFFLLFRLLPFRGPRALLFALPLVFLGGFAMWWGGLGVAAAIVAAIAFPNRFD